MKKTLFLNANIVPMTGRNLRYSSMGISGDTIDYLGNENPGGYDEVIDLHGKSVFPGLSDSHLHLLYSIVEAASSFNVCKITPSGIVPDTLSGVGTEVKSYCKAHPDQKLLVVNQYITPAIKEHRLPTAEELDEWTGGIKTVVFSIDGHSCSMSGAMMRAIGLQSKDGIFSGAEYDLSQGKITGYIASRVTVSTLIRGVMNFENECFRYGISKVSALDGEDTGKERDLLLTILTFLARRMQVKVDLFPQYMDFRKTETYRKKMKYPRIGGCSKWELDGSVGSYSAAFARPYTNGTEGKLYYEQSVIDEKIREGLSEGIQMTCHAIGTRAIDQIVDAYRKEEKQISAGGSECRKEHSEFPAGGPECRTNQLGFRTGGPMCRIDHFEFPSEEALDFVKKHRLAITVQPGYSYLDKRYIHSYESHLQKEDINLLVPLKELADAGVVLLGSSDSPVQSVNPYEQMRGMMEYYLPEQSLDAYEALKTYTYNSFLASGEPEGCLMVGNKADFFITDTDITRADSADLGSIVAEELYIDGKKMQRHRGTLGGALAILVRRPRKI